MASAEQETIPILLVTANVGSVFEDPSKLLHLWLREFLDHVAQRRPAFIALHLQEVGGKTYEKSMEYVQEFIKKLCESDELREYNRIRVYLDEDYNSAEHFTALGNLYFVQNTVDHVLMWNFLTHEWDAVEGKSIHTGSIETVASKEKAKFPQQFFPECKWSRKGFLRTRWFLSGTVFDLVNIHLFHDASNLAACEEYPSVYCKSRRRALVHTLERFHKDTVNRPVPYFVFGDFNFRCDTEGVIKKLTEDLTMHRVQNAKHDSTKVQYRDAEGSNVLTVGKKEFFHSDQATFKEIWLRQFDRELDSLRSILYEYPITFPPSYPYEEDPLQPNSYMATRCPAWCDRILVSPAARKLISDSADASSSIDTYSTDRSTSAVNYGIIGADVCMGDHKPVYLSMRIKTSQGILDYCSCDTHAPTTPRVEHPVPHSSSTSIYSSSNSHTITVVSPGSSGSNAGPAAKVSVIPSPAVGLPPQPGSLSVQRPVDSTSRGSSSANSVRHLCAFCTLRIEHCLEQNLVALEPDLLGAAADTLLAGLSTQGRAGDDRRPPVSISVFDTDSNLNVCLCAMYSSQARASEATGSETDPAALSPICPNCRNIIKHQPVEHRKTLISRRMMLANDIIVNRIDTHYLNTYTTLASNGATSDGVQAHYRFEPYTPESAESHSPLPESCESSKGSHTTTDTGTDLGDDGGGAGNVGDDDGQDDEASPLLLADEEEQQPLIPHGSEQHRPNMTELARTTSVIPIAAEVTIANVPAIATLPKVLKAKQAKPSAVVAGKSKGTSAIRDAEKLPTGAKIGQALAGGGGGGFSGVSPRQLKSRLEKLKRMADERRKQYGEWTRNRSRCDTARSDNSSSGTLTVPLGPATGRIGSDGADGGRDAAATSTTVPVLSINMDQEGGIVAKTSNNNVRQQGNVPERPPETSGAAVQDATATASPRDSILVGCCRRMCIIL